MDGHPRPAGGGREPRLQADSPSAVACGRQMLHLPIHRAAGVGPRRARPAVAGAATWRGWRGAKRACCALNAVFGIGWMVAQALIWAAVGAAIDYGVARHERRRAGRVGRRRRRPRADPGGLRRPAPPAGRHQLDERGLPDGPARRAATSSTTGTALTDEIPAGDVVNTVAADAMRVGGMFDSFARFSGRDPVLGRASLILLSTSVELGLVVLIGVPVLTLAHHPADVAAARDPGGPARGRRAPGLAGQRHRGRAAHPARHRRRGRLPRRLPPPSAAVRDAGYRVAGPQAGSSPARCSCPRS